MKTIQSLKDFQQMDVEKVARAVEADAGHALPGLRQSLREAATGVVGRMTTPEQIAKRRGRPAGAAKASTKVLTTLRLAPDVLAALRASGPGWQTRASEALRADLEAGRL